MAETIPTQDLVAPLQVTEEDRLAARPEGTAFAPPQDPLATQLAYERQTNQPTTYAGAYDPELAAKTQRIAQAKAQAEATGRPYYQKGEEFYYLDEAGNYVPVAGGSASASQISSNLAGAGIATSALPDIISQADLQVANEQAIRDEAEKRKLAMQGMISGQFDEAIRRREELGQKEIGGTEARLGITRGLGASSSRMQFIRDQQTQIARDIDTLVQAKADALTKLDFDMADKVEAQINELSDRQFKLQQVAFDQSMEVIGAQRQQAQDLMERIGQITAVGSEVPTEIKTQLDSQYGTGFTDKYTEAQKLLDEATSSEEILDRQKKQLDVMSKLNDLVESTAEGTPIPFGDSVYYGRKTDDPNVQIMEEVDAYGNWTMVAVDKSTFPPDIKVLDTVKGAGKGFASMYGGGSSTGGTGVSGTTAQELINSRGADGYVNTAIYQKAFDEATISGSKAVTDFFKQFPPAQMLNPKDATAIKFFQTKAQALSSGGNTVVNESNLEDTDNMSLEEMLNYIDNM